MDRDQRIRDPIHDLVKFSANEQEDQLLWELVRTRPVQRLRRIKQLGFSDFVYPGATHSRYSHVIGAMHMARRMLAVLERNSVFAKNDEHNHKRIATLAAALLHDIGHGPYSHVFEDISSDLGIGKSHETYTLDFIQGDEISTILDKYGVLKEVSRFFESEPGFDPYSAIISSQMDCDRLDFLVRDRYHTGIGSAIIDLEWLFDSLRIELIPIDPFEQISSYSFVVTPKGISVVEEFVLSYMKMYQSVYFHKTTRSVQMMVKDILNIIFHKDYKDEVGLGENAIYQFFSDESCRSTDNYLFLDDSSMNSLISKLARDEKGRAGDLSKRYLNRELYKAIEIPSDDSGQMKTNLASKFIAKLNDDNINYSRDTLPNKGYKQYAVMEQNYVKNILVKTDGEFQPLHKVSTAVRTLPGKQVRLYFPSSNDRENALKILEQCKVG